MGRRPEVNPLTVEFFVVPRARLVIDLLLLLCVSLREIMWCSYSRRDP